MFDLNSPVKPAAGGFGGLPPITPSKPFARPGGSNNQPQHNNSPPVIPTAKYPKPAAWVEKRVQLCARHHIRWLKWRAANIARLQAWVKSQPDYDESFALASAHASKIRNAFRANNSRA